MAGTFILAVVVTQCIDACCTGFMFEILFSIKQAAMCNLIPHTKENPKVFQKPVSQDISSTLPMCVAWCVAYKF